MKVAIVGSTGYIAGFILERFKKLDFIESVLKIDQTDKCDAVLNLENASNFKYDLLNDIDIVVFTAAISGPDKCATDYEFCWNINVVGTSLFIREALSRGCKVLFFSSDAVFGDIPGEIYTEDSDTKAVTPYGCMKKAIEDEFCNEQGFKAIRLSYVASAKDRFVSYCLDCVKNNTVAEVFHPFYRNVIVVSDVVNVVVWFVNNWNKYIPWVLNVSGKELVSRVRIADELNRNMNNKLNYVITVPGDSFYQNRPRITQMQSLYMNQYGILEDNTFTEKLKNELKNINM